MDKELSHQVTDVRESHGIEQAERKQKNLSVKWNTEQERRPRWCWEGQSRQPHLGLQLSATSVLLLKRQVVDQSPGYSFFCKDAPLTSLNTPCVLQPSVLATSDVRTMAPPKALHLKLTISSHLSGCWKPSMRPLRSGFKSKLLKKDPEEVQKWKDNYGLENFSQEARMERWRLITLGKNCRKNTWNN